MAQAKMVSAAERFAKATGLSTQDAFRELQSSHWGASASARIGGQVSTREVPLGLLFKAKGYVSASAGGDAGYRSTDEKTQSLTAEERKNLEEATSAVRDFRENQEIVKSTRLSHTNNLGSSENASLLQASTSLAEAHNKFDEFRANESRTHGLEELARSSASMNVNQHSNVNQEFVRYVQDKAPERATELLTDTESAGARQEREQLAEKFIGLRIEKELAAFNQANTAKVGGPAGAVRPARGRKSNRALRART
ncbi:hypothetical protein DM872_11515 [Pseudomonas taiwanensis]|uniref:hypothetical protein n=1 Tax=Pseudomonas taiwanensis TaxID=470150 RepID=UPI0015C0DFBE|nr:hypothetical protein [Pseudomonas taiwanensis]NWL77480.1 hypothetical protein [Pseudomonas taiwanensis]